MPLAFLETLAQLDHKDKVVLQDQLEFLGLLEAVDLQDFLVNVVPQALMEQLGLAVCLDCPEQQVIREAKELLEALDFVDLLVLEGTQDNQVRLDSLDCKDLKVL